MSNKYTAEVEIKIGDQVGILNFDYRALTKIESDLPDDLPSVFKMKMKDLIKMAAIGFEKKSPFITEEFIIDNSPPVIHLREKISEALLYSNWGPDDAKKFLKVDKDKKSKDDSKDDSNDEESEKKTE